MKPTALILGASSDIAIAIAKEYAANGYNIQLASRNHQRLAPLVSDIRIRYQVESESYEFDAANCASHRDFFNGLATKPTTTICVFGYLGDQQRAENVWSESEQIINTNFTGAVSILNIVASYYAIEKNGTIIGISSVAGERGRQSNYIYGSAKAGFTSYLSGLRNRLFHENVHVLTVKPGFVYTKMTENLKLPGLLTAKPEEVGRAVYKAASKKKNTIYVKWFWRWIMLIIKSVPEGIFKKLKL